MGEGNQKAEGNIRTCLVHTDQNSHAQVGSSCVSFFWGGGECVTDASSNVPSSVAYSTPGKCHLHEIQLEMFSLALATLSLHY